MLHQLKRHPFPVQATFRDVLVLTYAVEPRHVAPCVPPGLTLETHEGFALLAVALVQTEAMRPARLPAWIGQRFFLAGIRTFVRFRDLDTGGVTRRGLRILRSYTDRRLMKTFGNALTHYNYRLCRGSLRRDDATLFASLSSGDGELRAAASLNTEAVLPAASVFDDVRQARRFAGPMPLTFDYEAETGRIIVIRGLRERWTPRIVDVDVEQNDLVPPGAILSSAFHVADVPYHWARGRLATIEGGLA